MFSFIKRLFKKISPSVKTAETDTPQTVSPYPNSDGSPYVDAKWLEYFLRGEDSENFTEQRHTFEDIYVWKSANIYVFELLGSMGYKLIRSEIMNDCIVYYCDTDDDKATVFLYASDDAALLPDKSVLLSPDKAMKAYNSDMLILFLHVGRTIYEDGTVSYEMNGYKGRQIEMWTPEAVNGSVILLRFIDKYTSNLIEHFGKAFNDMNIDVFEAIFSPDICIDDGKGYALNEGIYNYLAFAFKNRGKLSYNYISNDNGVTYNKRLQFKDTGYIMLRIGRKISEIQLKTLCDTDLVILRGNYPALTYHAPWIESVKVLPAEPFQRFALRIEFGNGYVGKFLLPILYDDINKEVTRYNYHVFTEKIFSHFKIVDSHEPKHKGYALSGQGIEFINGCYISAIKLYDASVSHTEVSYINNKKRRCGDLSATVVFEWPGELYALQEWHENRYTRTIPNLLRAHHGKLRTFLDLEGNRKSTFDFTSFDDFFESLACVSVPNWGYGYIDYNINFVIPPVYERGKSFHGGYGEVRQDGKWIFIDKYGTEIVPEQEYVEVGKMSEGMFRVSTQDFELAFFSDHARLSIAGIWGYCDNSGKEVIRPQYIFAYDFENGIARVCKGEWTTKPQNERHKPGLYWSDEMLWGFIDKQGNEVVPCIYDEIKYFLDRRDMFIAHYGGWENGKWGVIDRKGNWLCEPIFDDITCDLTDDNCFIFRTSASWEDDIPTGVYSIPEQRVILEPAYMEIDPVFDGLFRVKESGEYKYIDREGNTAFEYPWIRKNSDYYEFSKSWRGDGGRGLMDKDRNIIVPHDERFRDISTKYRIICFEDNEKYGVMDFEGNVLIGAGYDKIDIYDAEIFKAKSDNKYGIITPKGILIPLNYDWLDIIDNKYAIAIYNNFSTFYSLERNPE